MANVAAPKTRILSGPGILYRAGLGVLPPGQAEASVSNKALTTNVATLTTSAPHGMVVGQYVTVAGVDATFNGTYLITAVPTTTTLTYAKTNADVASAAATGTVTTPAGGVVSGSVFTDSWPSGWIPIGVTKEGHEWSYVVSSEGVEVAEFLLPVLQAPTGAEGKVGFELVEYTGANLAWALNGGTLTTLSGSGATSLTQLSPPGIENQVRTQIGWESDDGTERGIFRQLLQTGTLTSKHGKGTNVASLTAEFTMEQPSTGDAFNRYYAGTAVLGQVA